MTSEPTKDGSAKKDPDECAACGSEKVWPYPIEDLAICKNCGYRFLGLPRNESYARDWAGDEYENSEVYRDA